MADMLIRDLDNKTLAALKARARRNGRSLQAELLELLQATAATERKDWLRLVDEIRAKTAGRKHSDSAELIAEDRGR